MSARRFGCTGVEIAPLALGAMNFGIATAPDEAAVMLGRAIDAGITLIDTADVYGESEQVVGEVLERTRRRDDVLLATKVGLPRGDGEPGQWHRREHIVASCDASLRNLRTDHIDLYQLHRPSAIVPFEETLGVLGELVDAGKVRWIGTSTFAAWMVADALALARERGPPAGRERAASVQPARPAGRQRTAADVRAPRGGRRPVVAVGRGDPGRPLRPTRLGARRLTRAAFLPMARERMNERALAVAVAVGELAAERGLTTSQMALLWTKDQPGVTAPIIGPRTLGQLDDALAVLDLDLDDDARAACDALVHPGNAVSDFYTTAFWMQAEVQ